MLFFLIYCPEHCNLIHKSFEEYRKEIAIVWLENVTFDFGDKLDACFLDCLVLFL